MKKVFYGFCLFFLVGLMLLPTLLSTRFIKNASLKYAQSLYKGKIELNEAHFGWFSGVHLKGIRINDEEGRSFIECAQIDLDKPLISWLYSWHSFGKISIQSPSLFIRPEKKRSTTSKKNYTSKQVEQNVCEEKRAFSIPLFQGSVSIHNATIVAFSEKKSLAKVSEGAVDLSLDLQHSSHGAIQANLSADSTPMTPLSLTFLIEGNPLSGGKADFSLGLDSVPAAIIGAFCQIGTGNDKAAQIVRESFGSSFTYTMKGSISSAGTELSSVLKSDNLCSNINASLVGSTFSLKEGTLFKGTLTPSLFSSLSALFGQKDISLLKSSALSVINSSPLVFDTERRVLLAPAHLTFGVQEPLALSVRKKPYFLACTGDMNGTAEEERASFSLSLTPSNQSPATCTLLCTRPSQSPILSLDLQGNIPSSFFDEKPISILENKTVISLKAHVDAEHESGVVDSLTVTSPTISAELKSMLFDAHGAVFSSPVTFSMTLGKTLAPQLTEGLFHAEIAPFTIENKNDAPVIKQPICIKTSGFFSLANIPDPFSFVAPIEVDVMKQEVLIKPSFVYQKRTLVSGGMFAKMSEEGPRTSGSLSFTNVPTALLANVASSQNLEALLGSTVSAQLEYAFQGLKEKGNHIAVGAQGEFWKAGAELRLVNGDILLGAKDAHVEARLSPERLETIQNSLNKKSDLSFRNSLTFSGSVSSLRFSILPLLEGKELTPTDLFGSLKLSSHFSLSDAEVVSQGKEIAHIAPLIGVFEVDGAKQHVELKISPEKKDQYVSPEADITVKEFMGKNGPLLAQASLEGTFKVNELPLRLVDLVSPGQGELVEEVIGKRCSAEGFLSSQKMEKGRIQCDIKADHASAHFDGAIKDGNLILNTPTTASLELTKHAGEFLFRDINPLLASAAHSEKPITVIVDPLGVSIPLQTFSLQSLTIPKVTVNVGKIVVKNGGALKIILALLKLGKAANSEELSLWLTPLHLEIHNGFVNCLRADALVADELHLITWGTDDLVRDNLDMTIAIPQETLNRVGIKLVAERGLQIPIKGSSSNPKVETARAAAKLAGSGAMTVSKDQRVRILGGLIQAAATVGEEEKTIPPQTTQPLPWQ